MVTLIHLLNENHIKLLCGCFYLVLAVAWFILAWIFNFGWIQGQFTMDSVHTNM